jgi:hypothetical protein
MPNLLLPVHEDHMNYASQHVVEAQEENYYQEYLNYVMKNTQREFPSNW